MKLVLFSLALNILKVILVFLHSVLSLSVCMRVYVWHDVSGKVLLLTSDQADICVFAELGTHSADTSAVQKPPPENSWTPEVAKMDTGALADLGHSSVWTDFFFTTLLFI